MNQCDTVNGVGIHKSNLNKSKFGNKLILCVLLKCMLGSQNRPFKQELRAVVLLKFRAPGISNDLIICKTCNQIL